MTPTPHRSVGTFRGDASEIRIGIRGKTDGTNQRGGSMNIDSIISVKLENNIYLQSSCANPPDTNTTALVDSAANVLLLANGAPSNESLPQLPTKTILQPSGARIFNNKTMKILLVKLPKLAREAHFVPGIINNLLSVSALCDAGCEVFFHSTGCEISFNREIIVRGWRDMQTNMWRIYLLDEGVSNIILAYSDGAMMPELVSMPITEGFYKKIYECETTVQLIQFYHATMGYHCTSTWCKAMISG